MKIIGLVSDQLIQIKSKMFICETCKYFRDGIWAIFDYMGKRHFIHLKEI